MNRSWLGRKARLWVEVGMGRTIQGQGCQLISGDFKSPFRSDRSTSIQPQSEKILVLRARSACRLPLATSYKPLAHPRSRVSCLGASGTNLCLDQQGPPGWRPKAGGRVYCPEFQPEAAGKLSWDHRRSLDLTLGPKRGLWELPVTLSFPPRLSKWGWKETVSAKVASRS